MKKEIETHTTRRVFGQSALALMTASVMACKSDMVQSDITSPQKTFVLVHGAWHGGWCWDFVREILEKNGHRVYTPTLSGLGENAEQLSAEIGLKTHIDDIVSLIKSENLSDIVLVGHSYAGMVITGVADAMENSINHIVYLDAVLPKDGESLLTQGAGLPEDERLGFIAYMNSQSDDGGISMRAPPAATFGLSTDVAELIKWTDDQLTPHPIKTWVDEISLQNSRSEELSGTYIFCTEPVLQGASFQYHFDRLSGKPNWSTMKLPAGHNAMISHPEMVANILENL